MAWPLYAVGGTRPTLVNNAANTGLYAYGSQSHPFGSRVWVSTTPSASTPSAFTASFTQLPQVRKAVYTPGETEKTEKSHLLSPYRTREMRGSWNVPGSYDLEFNATTPLREQLAGLTVNPTVADDNHRYLVVEDPNGSVHQVYGFFQPPSGDQKTIEATDNTLTTKFESCGIDYFVNAA